ncbi:MAG: hypothetical protein JSV92_01405 [archaeon]|nr:MAG: hypothetical protein JSV92_01405 [archaeon]
MVSNKTDLLNKRANEFSEENGIDINDIYYISHGQAFEEIEESKEKFKMNLPWRNGGSLPPREGSGPSFYA